MASRRTLLVLAAFASVYAIWGSTYLGIRWAIETMPPFLMASARWLLAGAILYAWRRARGDAAPTLAQWRAAAIVGALLVVGGNGTVSFAQQWVPSSLAALLVAVVPVYVAALEWAGPARRRPSPRAVAGILLGLGGVALLVGPNAMRAWNGGSVMAFVGLLLILAAAFSWATGSLWSRTAPKPPNLLLGASMQMLAGGALLAVVGVASGEAPRVDLAHVSWRSFLAFAFLVVFGSIVAYSAYVWLLQVVRAELVATYAFVNPVVAVLLGTLLAGEEFTLRTALVAALIVVAVALVVTSARVEAARPANPVGTEQG